VRPSRARVRFIKLQHWLGARLSELGVVKGEREKYVRTHADGYYSNDLLALDERAGARVVLVARRPQSLSNRPLT
jgi:hypothetical protein